MIKKTKNVEHAGGVVINSRKVNGGDEITYNDQSEHMVIIGSTGSGKTTQVIVPSAISIADSGAGMILFDPKGELYKLLSPYLEAKGYTCRLLDYTDPSSGACFNQLELINEYYADGLPALYVSEGYHLITKYLRLLQKGYASTLDDDFLQTLTNNPAATGTKPQQPMFTKNLYNYECKDDISLADALNELCLLLCNAQVRIDANFNDRTNEADPYTHNVYLYEKQRQTINAANKIINSLVPLVVSGDTTAMTDFFTHRIEELKALIESLGESRETDKCRHQIDQYNAYLDRCHESGVTWDSVFFYLKEKENWYHAQFLTNDEAAMQNAKTIANMIIDSADTGRAKGEAIWSDGPKALISALILLTAREGLHVEESHLGSVYMQLSTLMSPLDTTGQTGIDVIMNNFLDDDSIKLSDAAMRIAPDKTKSSIVTSAISPMTAWSVSVVVGQSSKTDFNLTECQEKPVAYFLNIPGADAASPYVVLGSLFVEQMYTVLSNYCQYSKDLSLKRPMYYLLDEFCNSPAIPNFDSKVSLARSKKIRFCIVIQSIAQLEKTYKEAKNTVLENSNLLYLLTNSSDTADFISKRLGKRTIKISNSSVSSQPTGNSSTKTSTSESTQTIGRELMTSQEIMAMPPGHGLFIKPRENPCRVQFVPSYKLSCWPEIAQSQLFEIHQPRPRTQVKYFLPSDYRRFTLAYRLFYHHALLDADFIAAEEYHNSDAAKKANADAEKARQQSGIGGRGVHMGY